ncbi:hypothetical protein V494_05249 [Pseudogymnoascus sp. VKM F-4513 (FW-928)]|nr:hypothetical protein V494_05249 [Pseudogymnoascus sp. VKM F-4513 (FW-928)]
MADSVMEASDIKRKATRSLRGSSKRVKTESAIDPAFFSSDSEDDDNYSDHGESGGSDDEEPEPTETPQTPFSPPQRKFPSELKTIKCTYEGCTKTFNRPVRLASHLRSHTNERPFACTYPDCDKAYIEEKHLKQHIKGSHTHERNHHCDWEGCTKSFLTATRLRRHQAAHGGHERFRCTEYPPCTETFRKHQTLQRHIRSDHLKLTPFPCTFIDPTTNVQCTAGYDSAGALRKHEDRLHGALRFWCDVCTSEGAPQPAGFPTNNQLAKHIRNEHANCIFCDLRCSSERELQRHIETFHAATSSTTARKQIPCTYPGCDKSFTKKYNLDVHVRTSHEGQRFICGQTDFSKSVKLRTWDGSDACGKDFVSKVNLEDHIRTQHLGLPSTVNARRVKKNSIGAKPRKAKAVMDDAINALTGTDYAQDPVRNIPCDIGGCSWMFSRDYDLIQHKRVKHGIVPVFETKPEVLQPDYGMMEAAAEQPMYGGPPHISDDRGECERLSCPHWDHVILYDDYYGLDEFMGEEGGEVDMGLQGGSEAGLEYPEPPDYMTGNAYDLEI